MKKFLALLLALVMAFSLVACGGDKTPADNQQGDNNGDSQYPEYFAGMDQLIADAQAEGELTVYGSCEEEYLAAACENFEKLVKKKFYDGLTFHRVVDGFMAQGGDPNGDGTGGSKETIKGEFSANGVENSLSHTRGVVSMARASDMNSASSQFFICYSDKDTFLDGQYAAFGMVTEGMDVVDDFLKVERTTGSDNAQSKPVTPITIVKAEMIDDDADGNHRVQFTMNF